MAFIWMSSFPRYFEQKPTEFNDLNCATKQKFLNDHPSILILLVKIWQFNQLYLNTSYFVNAGYVFCTRIRSDVTMPFKFWASSTSFFRKATSKTPPLNYSIITTTKRKYCKRNINCVTCFASIEKSNLYIKATYFWQQNSLQKTGTIHLLNQSQIAGKIHKT